MSNPTPSFSVNVDVTNPGQFFACCGLLELAHRLWPGAEGWFEATTASFGVSTTESSASLGALLSTFKSCALTGSGAESNDEGAETDDNDTDEKAAPLLLGQPFDLLLDWFAHESNKDLKPWAGSMNGRLILLAMKSAIDGSCQDPFAQSGVVSDSVVENPTASTPRRRRVAKPKKREPFYFDARRGSNAKSVDVGFAPDAISMTSAACPAVEALCLVGLQRFRPAPAGAPRVFDYWTWYAPLLPALAAAAVCGRLPGVGGERYRFENAFRTDQRKHKGFLAAIRVPEGDLA